jgi:hypothetical protein
MKKRNRTIEDYISILTYIWIKWINNHEISNDKSLSFSKRREGGERCERLQAVRQKIIILLNREFENKLLNFKDNKNAQ